MKEEKDGETRSRGDVDGGGFDQAVMEQRGAEDSEDSDMKPMKDELASLVEATQLVLQEKN